VFSLQNNLSHISVVFSQGDAADAVFYIRYGEDSVDQLFNSSEKRLARVLLMLAHFGKEGVPETVVPKISQETLADMVGTTRSRVSFFMNRFRKLGFIHYAGGPEGKLQVHSSLLNVVLHD
jgi:CRP/FNR family transcriptional regulator, cyclic AMP receptor protein